MNITYTQNGDYLIPNIVIRKTKPLGHYGRLRKAYLEMHRPILFNELVLWFHVSCISQLCNENDTHGNATAGQRKNGKSRCRKHRKLIL